MFKLAIPLLVLYFLFPISVMAQSSPLEKVIIPQDVSQFLSQPVLVPGSPFYKLKRFIEMIGDWVTFDKIKQSTRDLVKAKERLSEANVLLKRGNIDQAAKLMDDYKLRLDQGVEVISSVKDKEELSGLLSRVTGMTENYDQYLSVVVSKVPIDYQSRFKEAFVSTKKWKEYLQTFSKVIFKKAGQVGENILKTGEIIDQVNQELEEKLKQEKDR